jgi:alcohol dehydrogenase class IV
VSKGVHPLTDRAAIEVICAQSTEADLADFVAKALQDPCAGGNPVVVSADDVLRLYREAM